MKHENSVTFRLSPPMGRGMLALEWFLQLLEAELKSRGFIAVGKKLSGLSYGVLSYPATHGHVSVFVLWPVRGDQSSWEIRTAYFCSWLKRVFRTEPPGDAIQQLERIH